jgi:large conductance mechanosensitive channel
MLKGFRDFVLRGNVVDLAVAVILGAAFNTIVASLVTDVLNPLIAATIGKPDFSAVIVHVGSGQLKIGSFLNALGSFLIVAFAVYFAIVAPTNLVLARLKKPEAPPSAAAKNCAECLSEIPAAAKRCRFCGQPAA